MDNCKIVFAQKNQLPRVKLEYAEDSLSKQEFRDPDLKNLVNVLPLA